jgi:hypothetical protein
LSVSVSSRVSGSRDSRWGSANESLSRARSQHVRNSCSRTNRRRGSTRPRAVGRLFAELAATTGTAIVCATHDPVLIDHARVEVPLATLAK